MLTPVPRTAATKNPPSDRITALGKETFTMADIYFHLPLLIVLISLVYSGTRYESWPSILLEAVRWGLRMLGFLLGIGVVLFVVSRLFPLGLVPYVLH